MNQYGSVRIDFLKIQDTFRFKLFVNNTTAVPHQYVGPRIFLYVGAQIFVWRPKDFLALTIQIIDNVQRYAGRHYPVGSSLNRSRGVGINHHGSIGMLIAERIELN